MSKTETAQRVTGVVVIGRNEGTRLAQCIKSVSSLSSRAVYVDSGSTDNSIEIARSSGADVVSLDLSTPFTAARARNEGLFLLREKEPKASYVQFVDGDCEIIGGWVEAAKSFLDEHPNVVAVCGRLRERFPEHSIYNLLCNLEWDAPIGDVRACGGIAMFRIQPVIELGGFRTDLIAGEEPELCLRLRSQGWQIHRLDRDMALHDAAMHHFGQWWTRTMRGGFAAAQGSHLHGNTPEKYKIRETRSIWLWGLLLPMAILLLVALSPKLAAILLLIYPVQIARLALSGKHSIKENWYRAFFLVLGKIPEMLGQLKFLKSRIAGRNHELIEYK
jgi:GT2 family glycosyltransferase